jgi:hypothetical protein
MGDCLDENFEADDSFKPVKVKAPKQKETKKRKRSKLDEAQEDAVEGMDLSGKSGYLYMISAGTYPMYGPLVLGLPGYEGSRLACDGEVIQDW